MLTGKDIWNYCVQGDILVPHLSRGTWKLGTVGVYTGFQEINNHRAPTKVGKTVDSVALNRGRSQGGANWWFASFFILPNKECSKEVEKTWHHQMKSQNFKGIQGQTELYYFSAEDAADELEGVIRSLGLEARDLVEEILENRLSTAA